MDTSSPPALFDHQSAAEECTEHDSGTMWERLLCRLISSATTISSPTMASMSDMHQSSKHIVLVEQHKIVPEVEAKNTLRTRRPTTPAATPSRRRTTVTVPKTTTTAAPPASSSYAFPLLSSSSLLPTMFTFLALFALFASLPTAQSATFFYGATEEAAANENNVANLLKGGELGQQRALQLAAQAAAGQTDLNDDDVIDSDNGGVAGGDDDSNRLSKTELEAVYNFCAILPQMQQQGFVAENKHARTICKKLVDMLKPMFRKRSRSVTALRPRRHLNEAAGMF